MQKRGKQMKRLAIVSSVAAALLLASVALAAVKLHGTYKTTITNGVVGGVLKGPWTIKFNRPNYTVSEDGIVEVRGKYALKGHAITFHDKTGRDACPGAGKYTAHLRGRTVTFSLTSDPNPNCLGRRTVLGGTFTKVG
jgi:hypothetical protein